MKKTFLLILTIILTLGTVFSLSACKKKNKQNEVDISKNVSYAETHRYVGENEDFKVAVTSGVREKLFIADGKATDVQNFTEITLIPLKANLQNKTYTFVLNYDGGSAEGELKRDVVTHNFTAVIDAERFKDTIKSIVIKYDKVESEIPLENALNGKIDYCKVLDIAKTALKDEIGANTTDGVFNREIMVKLVRDRRAPDSPYYWYISFIAGDNGYWALLINPETGDVVSKKN